MYGSILSTVLLAFDQYGKWRNPLDIIQGIDLIDMMALPLYILAILFITYIVKVRYYHNSPMGKYLLWGVFVKMVSALAFAAVYIYHYDGIGDTFYYFEGAKPVQEAWLHSPDMGFRVLGIKAGNFEPITFPYTVRIKGFWRGDGEMVSMCKIVGTIMVLGFQSYWLTTVLVAFVGFSGLWKLFRFFAELYPDLTKEAAFAVFFIPSALFWGSGILKDTICFGALGWVNWSLYQLVLGKNITKNLLTLILFSVIILSLKAYIIFAFIPGVAIWLILRFKPKSKAIVVKYTLTPFVVAIMTAGVFLGIQGISKSSSKYALDNVDKKVQGFHSDHGNEEYHQGASVYSLGEVEYSTAGYLKKFPLAVNVTYFRPYPWEISDPFQAISSLESLVFFYLFITTLIKVGIGRFFTAIVTNPEVGLCAAFALLFGFAVGLTAYNFGALVRFKIPALPYFIMMLMIIRNEYFKSTT